MEEKMLVSASATIGMVQVRQLIEVTQSMKHMLTFDEFVDIMIIYDGAMSRLLEENGLEE